MVSGIQPAACSDAIHLSTRGGGACVLAACPALALTLRNHEQRCQAGR